MMMMHVARRQPKKNAKNKCYVRQHALLNNVITFDRRYCTVCNINSLGQEALEKNEYVDAPKHDGSMLRHSSS